MPLAQWLETVNANNVAGHLDELKSVMTSMFGRILKLDSTKLNVYLNKLDLILSLHIHIKSTCAYDVCTFVMI